MIGNSLRFENFPFCSEESLRSIDEGPLCIKKLSSKLSFKNPYFLRCLTLSSGVAQSRVKSLPSNSR
jgi:hypothetical protein